MQGGLFVLIIASLRRYYPVQVIRVDEKIISQRFAPLASIFICILLTTINIAVLDLVVNLKCLFPFGQHLQFVHNFIIGIFWKEEYGLIVE